jgi:hypothetical protein
MHRGRLFLLQLLGLTVSVFSITARVPDAWTIWPPFAARDSVQWPTAQWVYCSTSPMEDGDGDAVSSRKVDGLIERGAYPCGECSVPPLSSSTTTSTARWWFASAVKQAPVLFVVESHATKVTIALNDTHVEICAEPDQGPDSHRTCVHQSDLSSDTLQWRIHRIKWTATPAAESGSRISIEWWSPFAVMLQLQILAPAANAAPPEVGTTRSCQWWGDLQWLNFVDTATDASKSTRCPLRPNQLEEQILLLDDDNSPLSRWYAEWLPHKDTPSLRDLYTVKRTPTHKPRGVIAGKLNVAGAGLTLAVWTALCAKGTWSIRDSGAPDELWANALLYPFRTGVKIRMSAKEEGDSDNGIIKSAASGSVLAEAAESSNKWTAVALSQSIALQHWTNEHTHVRTLTNSHWDVAVQYNEHAECDVVTDQMYSVSEFGTHVSERPLSIRCNSKNASLDTTWQVQCRPSPLFSTASVAPAAADTDCCRSVRYGIAATADRHPHWVSGWCRHQSKLVRVFCNCAPGPLAEITQQPSVTESPPLATNVSTNTPTPTATASPPLATNASTNTPTAATNTSTNTPTALPPLATNASTNTPTPTATAAPALPTNASTTTPLPTNQPTDDMPTITPIDGSTVTTVTKRRFLIVTWNERDYMTSHHFVEP